MPEYLTLWSEWQCNRLRKFRSPSHDAANRVYDAAGSVIETHEHKSDFREV